MSTKNELINLLKQEAAENLSIVQNSEKIAGALNKEVLAINNIKKKFYNWQLKYRTLLRDIILKNEAIDKELELIQKECKHWEIVSINENGKHIRQCQICRKLI